MNKSWKALGKKVMTASIFDVSSEKPENFKLTSDSTSMGFAAFLKEGVLGFELEREQRSDVFMNSLIVTMV